MSVRLENPAALCARAELDLAGRGDDELRKIIADASALLEARESKRKQEAIAEIQRIAREQGLVVRIGTPARRRGRPPKSEQTAKQMPERG
jgi:hypothetical protein